ncbi:MAG TPA: cbb3-type cytochrome c oxidase subunit I, partial [Dehalococcoidales bacterium]|nr:cbb3-type cytochrome c oxidase subunit I [Dehalococcoidales bacterium]
FFRGTLAGLAGTAAGMGITMLVRIAMGLPGWNEGPVVVIGIFTGVICYLLALGVFNYWFRRAVGAMPAAERLPAPGWRRYFNVDTNHKVIGIQYLVISLIFLPFAVALQLTGRLDITHLIPTLSLNAYESIISVHGLIMFFIVVIPAFTGLMNYLIPLLIGARDMAFPRLNALTFWLLPPAGLLVAFSLLGGGVDTGWTAYPPLAASFENIGMDLVLLGIYLGGFSTILGAVNILTTIFKMRAPGMKFFRMPIFIWASLGTTLMTLVFTQFIAMAFLMVLLERTMGMGFFNPQMGGQVLLYQYLFWFYSHPAVYVFVLLGLGIISDIIPVFARKPLFGYRGVAIATLGIAAGGTIVFGHHMFAAGMPAVLRVPFMVTTLLVAVPTGVKVFAWVATMWMGKIRLDTPLLFVLSSIVIFMTGGLAGIPLGIVPVDLYLHDTYWVVGHFHAMIFGGFLLPVMAAIYYWFPKATGRMLREGWGKIQWGLMTLGSLLLFVPMLGLGLEGMRRRVTVFPSTDPVFRILHLITVAGGFLVFAGIVILIYNIVVSLKRGKTAGNNPWGGRTLEWMVSSPPPENNFDEIPEVLDLPHLHGVSSSVHARIKTNTEPDAKQE